MLIYRIISVYLNVYLHHSQYLLIIFWKIYNKSVQLKIISQRDRLIARIFDSKIEFIEVIDSDLRIHVWWHQPQQEQYRSFRLIPSLLTEKYTNSLNNTISLSHCATISIGQTQWLFNVVKWSLKIFKYSPFLILK